MIGKIKEAANAARLRAGQMWRDRKERIEAKKATAALNSEHGHGRFFLLHVPAMATICAAVVEWYWAILFCIEATGSIDWNYQTTTGSAIASASVWNFAFSTHWPIFLGLVCATVPIVMLSMVWLPVQFAMRGSGMWRRGTVIAVGVLANLLVIVSGTVVMNGNRQEQVREAVVMEQTAAQGRAAIDARLAFEQEQLRLALTNENAYLNQAASVGAAEWERSYVAQARATNDPRLPQLERALGAARAADERRANIERLTIERATAAPEAASAANVEDTVGRELNTFAQIVEVWRPPFVAVICCLIGIFGAWWVLALMQGLNPRDVMRSGWADEGHRIEDMREQEPVAPQPMRPAREVVTDAETGEELIKITPKPHWRKQKGKKQKVEFSPDIPPDETGVEHDGGGRVASVATADVERGGDVNNSDHGAAEDAAEIGDRVEPFALSEDQGSGPQQADNEANGEALNEAQNDSPSEALPEPELTEAERAEFAMLAATDASADHVPEEMAEGESDGPPHAELPVNERSSEYADGSAESDVSLSVAVDQTDLPAEREPETNPAKLIAAE